MKQTSDVESNFNNWWFYDAIDYDPGIVVLPNITTSIKVALIDSGFNNSLDSIRTNVWKNPFKT